MARHPNPERRGRGALSRALRAAPAAAILLLAGCYTFVPVSLENAAPPMRVRAQLTPEASARVAPALGAVRTSVNGLFVERTPEGLYLDVAAAQVQEGFATETLTQRLLLAPGDVLLLQRRQLDRVRTGAMVGAGAALVGFVAYQALSGEGGGSTSGTPPGGGPEARIPLLTIPVR